MKNLNENEAKAMRAICADCDEIDGYGFTRPADMAWALFEAFDRNAHVAGGYITSLSDKGLIELDMVDNTVWVEPEVFEQFC